MMEFVSGLSALKAKGLGCGGCVATIGAFDGVHLGHQQLLEGLNQAAKALGLPSTVIIFEPQPNEYFNPAKAPARLTRLREKVSILAAYGAQRVLCLKFSEHLRALSAGDFVQAVLVNGLGVKKLIVGDDFRFGCDRSGDFQFLQQAGATAAFEVSDTRTFRAGPERVSSTYIRSLLAAGDLEGAEVLLGRPYANLGRVIYGRQLGRQLGFPTMNVGLARLSVPLSGVFAVRVQLGEDEFNGVANVGIRPTVNESVKPLLEVHVFDAAPNAYGQCIRVEYRKKLRDEMRFSNVTELQAQIEQDTVNATAFFDSHCKT